MKYRRLDENGDYTFGGGQYDFCSDADAVAQAIKTKLLLLKQEWWEDMQDGTDLFEGILLQDTSDSGKNAIDIIIKNRILSIQEVQSINEFNSYINKTAKTYTAELKILTVYGVVEENFTVGG